MSHSADVSTLPEGLYAHITTGRGDIVLSLAFDQVPLTVASFVGLAEGTFKNSAKQPGVPYYDGVKFHRVVPGFVIQGGDPLGDGRGGPGYTFADEFDSTLRHDKAGIVSMANAGPKTNGSQFFITLGATPHLNDKHSVFGSVVIGMDVVESIEAGDVMESMRIIRNGEKAQNFKVDQESFDAINRGIDEKADLQKKAEKAKLEAIIVEKWPNAKTTDSGMRHIVDNVGIGAKPNRGDSVLVHYTGMFVSGEVFDSSVARNEPFELEVGVGMVIPGWDITLLDMQAGEKRTVIIPSELAYGERGAGGVIPPDATLVFEVELIKIK